MLTGHLLSVVNYQWTKKNYIMNFPLLYSTQLNAWVLFSFCFNTILEDTIQCWKIFKPTFCANYVMSSRLLKQTFDCSHLSFVSKILEKDVLQQLL